jgi:hypothetical protein
MIEKNLFAIYRLAPETIEWGVTGTTSSARQLLAAGVDLSNP